MGLLIVLNLPVSFSNPSSEEEKKCGLNELRACEKITSHFRIPSSAHLCLRLNRKILEIPPILAGLFLWICSIGAAKSDLYLGANSVKLFLRKPL